MKTLRVTMGFTPALVFPFRGRPAVVHHGVQQVPDHHVVGHHQPLVVASQVDIVNKT